MNQLNDANWDYAGRNIVVTGATGLYGQELVKRLVEKGAHVKTISRHPLAPGDFVNLDGVTHVTGDLMDRSFADHIMAGACGLFHFAGLRGSVGIQQSSAASLLHNNTLICFNTLEAARQAGLEKILYVSTVTVYPPLPEYHEHLMWSAPPSASVEYVAWSKRMAEKLIEAYEVQYGSKNIAIVRPVNTFGPYDDFNPETALVIPALIKRAVDGENPFVVWGDGTAVRDFLYVSDAIDGILLAFEKGCGMGAFNLGSGNGYTIREIVESVCQATGHTAEIQWNSEKPSGDKRKIANIERARNLLGFAPKIPITEGIEKTVDWYLENRDIK